MKGLMPLFEYQSDSHKIPMYLYTRHILQYETNFIATDAKHSSTCATTGSWGYVNGGLQGQSPLPPPRQPLSPASLPYLSPHR